MRLPKDTTPNSVINTCMRTPFVSVSLALLLAACTQGPDIVFEKPPEQTEAVQTSSTSSSEYSSSPVLESRSVLIKLPFVPQAPFANWDALHQEACEEMSLILVRHYLEGTNVTAQQAEQELQEVVSWMDDIGLPYDVTMEELARVAEEKYGLKARVRTDVTIESIKAELAAGNPVILPLAGQMLGNPYYSGDGPPYHVFVVVGYDNDEFITHDVGTKRGANYRYDQEVVFNAIHDWTGSKETIEQGKKAMLVVTK